MQIKPAYAESHFDGGYVSASNLGVAATIETQNPYIDSGGSSSAWVGNTTGDSAYKYTQGWYKDDPMTSPAYFYEWSNSLTDWSGVKYIGPAANGSNNDFEVTWDSTGAYFSINNISYGSVLRSQLTWSPAQVQVTGETKWSTDESPGSTSNHVSMGKTFYKDTSGNWISSPIFYVLYTNLTTQKNTIGSGASSWDIWDSRY